MSLPNPAITPPAVIEEVRAEQRRLEKQVYTLERRFSKLELEMPSATLAFTEVLGHVVTEVKLTNQRLEDVAQESKFTNRLVIAIAKALHLEIP